MKSFATGSYRIAGLLAAALLLPAVADANTPPVAGSEILIIPEDGSGSFTLIATDPEGDSISWVLLDLPFFGSLSGTPPNLTYRPEPNFYGPDRLVFLAFDPGDLVFNRGLVQFDVRNSNDPPVAAATLVETDEDVPRNFAFAAIDADRNRLTFNVDSLGPLGTIAGTTADAVQFLPALNENGETTVNYTVNDGEFTSSALLTVRIRPVNDLPQAAAGELSLDEDSSLAIILDAEDPEGDAVISEVITGPEHGSLVIDGAVPNYRYTPDPDYFGPDSFTYALGDGFGTTQATISLNVAPVADAPIAALIDDLTMDEDSVGTQTVSATNPDGRTLIYLLDAAPPVGRLDLDPLTGSLSFTPPTNYVGTISYTWHATYGVFARDPETALYVWRAEAGAPSSAPDTVSIIVRPVNDDDDSDAILDLDDNCPLVSNTDQFDADADASGDACDEDLDGDTVANLDDNCPLVSNADQANADADASGDACDLDDDGDGINDPDDNCPLVANTDQADLNGDGTGNLCDDDQDGDGINDPDDNCELVANADQADLDADGLGDLCDLDDDGDTVADLDDACPTTSGDGPDGCPLATDAGTDAAVDTGTDTTVDSGTDTTVDSGTDTGPVAGDSDGDGVPDSADNCPSVSNADQRDSDRDGLGPECDNCPGDSNSDQRDGDGDGIGDKCDVNPNSKDEARDDLAGCGIGDCSAGSSTIRSTLLMALFAVVGLLWRRKPRATVGR